MKRSKFQCGPGRLIIWCLFLLLDLAGYSQVRFLSRFNPSMGAVKDAEKPFRGELCLNGKWQIAPLYTNDTSGTAIPASLGWEEQRIKIPSPWNVNGFPGHEVIDFTAYPSYPAKWEKATQAWLKTSFLVPANWDKDRLILHFEAVAGKAVYYLNGKKIGENFDIFFPYEMDVTDKIRRGQKNDLLVLVQGAGLFDRPGKYGRRPYVSGSFWGTWIRGIWDDVYLLSRPAVHIDEAFIGPELNKMRLLVNVTVSNQTNRLQSVDMKGAVYPWIRPADQDDMIKGPVESDVMGTVPELLLNTEGLVRLAPGESKNVQVAVNVKPGQLKEWSPEHPDLHVLLLNLSVNGRQLDRKYQRFGWRQFTFRGNSMLLNGKPIHLKGDSWHFMGVPQMTRRYPWAWFTMLKDAGANAVRLHAEPFPSFYLDIADQMGICVLDESGIWASDGGPDFGSDAYWENCSSHLKRLVLRDRNHPAVFGWSVCNEVIPVAKNVFHMPDSLLRGIVSRINGWIKDVQYLDSTRPWISGDGETDLKTRLPTVIGHYGNAESMENWAKEGLPWGIGEQSMAYYGTPKQVATINGPRAYVSQQGRMEGLAMEAYALLKKQQSLNATYSSVFNIVWYGLKPLTLGMRDISKPTRLEDGIFFTRYMEGEPGMQPERLGPYTTTLNPGYDSDLPLFEPWPFFYAIRDANRRPRIKDSAALRKLDQRWAYPVFSGKPKVTAAARKVYYFGNEKGALYHILMNLGLKLEPADQLPLPASDRLIVIDGKHPPAGRDSIAFINDCIKTGADVLILGVASDGLDLINRLLPAPVVLTGRSASSLVIQAEDPVLTGLDNSDWYFSELSKKPVMTSGFAGPVLKTAKVLLRACAADWNNWNGRPEYVKTADILKSERVQKASGDILIKLTEGKGSIYLFGCDIVDAQGALNGVTEQMLKNLGAAFDEKVRDGPLALSKDGMVQAALYCGRFGNAGLTPEAALARDFGAPSMPRRTVLGEKQGSHQWRAAFTSGHSYRFDLKALAATGPEDGATGYFSFWVYCPRSLSNLLAEPDMPSVALVIEANDDLSVKLNNQKILEHLNEGGTEIKIPDLQLNKGWNHILIKSVHTSGDWKTGIGFRSSQPDFVRQLYTALQQ